MTPGHDPNGDDGAARPVPFVVTHPCPACGGAGKVGEQACAACSGTGATRFLHGTKAHLGVGDLIEAGHGANFGKLDRTTTYVYFTGTLDAATWGAELALGEGRGRIYVVEPTGTIEDDPNLTDKRFPGNPTKSFRSLEPLRVVGEVEGWIGHTPEQLQEMRRGVERAAKAGDEPID